MAKKKKQKYIVASDPAGLLKQAEDRLKQGEAAAALEHLRRAEPQLQPRVTIAGKKMSIPPHLVAAQAAFQPLLARTLHAYALTLADPKAQIAALTEAVERLPGEPRYLLARGACRLLHGAAEAAHADFAKADELRPDDALTTQAFALGLTATGRAQQAAELLNHQPIARRDARWRRLGAIGVISYGTTPVATSDQLLNGLSHLAAGDAVRAGELLAELPAFDRSPAGAEAAALATQFFYSGALHFNAGRERAALNDWREAVKLMLAHAPTAPWRGRLTAYLHHAAERADERDPALAFECRREILRLAPDDAVAANNLIVTKRAEAMRGWRAGDTVTAVTLWQEALQTKPQDEHLLRYSAVGCEKLNRKDEAVKHWRALTRLWRGQRKQRAEEPGFNDRLLQLEKHVVKLMLESDLPPDQVLNELEAALKVDPDHHELREQLADLLMELGRAHQALKHLQEIERRRGVSVDLLVRRAQAYDQQNQRKEARQTFERALALEPNNAVARRGFLIFLGQEAGRAEHSGNLDRAEALCRQQLALDPQYAQALGHLAALHFTMHHDKDARAMLDRLIALDPKDPVKHVKAGAIYLDFDFNKEAKAAFAQALALDAGAPILFMIGVSYWDAENHKEALKYFDRVAETGPKEMLMEIAMHLHEGGEQKAAKRFLDKVKQLDPTDPLPYLIKAMALVVNPINLISVGKKEREEAVAGLAEAERLIVGSPQFAEMLPVVQQLKQILERGPASLLDMLSGRLGGGFGPPPGFLDDDDDDGEFFGDPGFFEAPPRAKKKRRK